MRLKFVTMLIVGLWVSGVVGQEVAKTPGMEMAMRRI
jgi:hypothetical protein